MRLVPKVGSPTLFLLLADMGYVTHRQIYLQLEEFKPSVSFLHAETLLRALAVCSCHHRYCTI